ncbi:hypothetical protein F4814DRAFT_43438 [Daldinia grandis]|nr:hypothetical protein F4814DRAFT_43438 [Daldinia grandis]
MYTVYCIVLQFAFLRWHSRPTRTRHLISYLTRKFPTPARHEQFRHAALGEDPKEYVRLCTSTYPYVCRGRRPFGVVSAACTYSCQCDRGNTYNGLLPRRLVHQPMN